MGGKKQKQKKKGKAGAAPGLGRALLRHRHEGPGSRHDGAGWLHTSQLNDGYDWGRLNLQSVTEQDSLEEFLATAELAGTEFVAEKLNIKIVPAEAQNGLPTAEETKKIQELQEQNKQFLCIPRRPPWDKHTSPEVLSQAERESFLEWRRQLARLEEEQKLLLTPFERNLDFWRQLWRVLERSDVVVQIVDARNPLLFRCQDLELYVREISPEKENLILLNKADLLSEEQRSAWARFFEQEGVKVVFWSALEEGRRLAAAPKGMEAVEEPGGEAESSTWRDQRAAFSSSSSSQEESEPDSPSNGESDHEEDSDVYEDCEEEEEEEEEAWRTCSEEEESGAEPSGSRGNGMELQAAPQDGPVRNSSCLLPREKLLETFQRVHAGKRKVREGEVTVGLVGYPNVGKSSTINAILGKKKVSVSATPGHTKHFQTLYVEPGLCLCDCPGLVMPSFVSTKAEMICSGILPIDQMRDHVPPTSLICQRIPRHILDATYGINLIQPREDELPDRPPTSEELLTAYGCMRGFMTDHGQPDQPRSARYLLKDYVMGKLLYCHPPPGTDPRDFQLWGREGALSKATRRETGRHTSRNPRAKQIENLVDTAFFHQDLHPASSSSSSPPLPGERPCLDPRQPVGPGMPRQQQQARPRYCWRWTGGPWKALEETRQQEQEGESPPPHQAPAGITGLWSSLAARKRGRCQVGW